MAERRPAEPFTAYLAAPSPDGGYVAELVQELGWRGLAPEQLVIRERLVLAPGEPVPAAWAQNVWRNPRFLDIASISDAARQLKAIQRNWSLSPIAEFRRAQLIADKLPPVAARPLAFGDGPPGAPLGAWTLWDRDTILASPETTSPFPHGEVQFVEDKTGPPSRAYLKLWELFTITGIQPAPGDLCLDLGSAPGGWSWVLARLGARVFSIDKAPLDPGVASDPLVEHCQGSGFGLEPNVAGAVDWLFCDMACYPDRLHGHILRWLERGECRRFACTLKFQGATDMDTVRAFSNIPGSRLFHLSHNKHELTWLKAPGC